MSSSSRGPSGRVRLSEVRSEATQVREDEVATEEPLEVRVRAFDGAPGMDHRLAVTMRTPGQDFELAVGFLLSEGVVRSREEVSGVSYCTDPEEPQRFNVVVVRLAAGVSFDVERFRRNVYTTSSCGICGRAALEQVRATVRRAPVGSARLAPDLLHGLPARLRESQTLFGRTGGIHAAGLFDPEGRLLALREDVGRHNAVDKLVGTRLLEGRLPDSNTVLLVSGRASFELVQKAALAGIPALAAIGAPSTLAVELAHDEGMTLVGFLRPDRFNVYAGGERILGG
jgi:FdhD protein